MSQTDMISCGLGVFKTHARWAAHFTAILELGEHFLNILAAVTETDVTMCQFKYFSKGLKW